MLYYCATQAICLLLLGSLGCLESLQMKKKKKYLKPKKKSLLFRCSLKTFVAADFCSHVILSERFDLTEKVKETNVFFKTENEEK